jgi:integrase
MRSASRLLVVVIRSPCRIHTSKVSSEGSSTHGAWQGLDVASIYSILSVLLNHAVKRGKLVESPLKRLDDRERLKRRSKNPSRCLTDADCSALIANALPSTRDLIAFYAFTGVRRSEGLGLVWDDFDFERVTVKIRAQLDRKTSRVPSATPRFVHATTPVAAASKNVATAVTRVAIAATASQLAERKARSTPET